MEPRLAYAKLLQQSGHLDEALREYRDARRLQPGDARICCLLAECYWQCGKVRHAIAAYERAINLGIEDFAVFTGLAAALASLGRQNEALENFNRAEKLSPHDADLYADRGALLYAMHRLEDAEKDINHALRLDPANAEAFLTRADIRLQRHDLDGAVCDLAAAAKLLPEDTATVIRWLRAVAAAGDPAEALHLLDNILERTQEADFVLLKGDLLHECGRHAEARAVYNKILQRSPDDQEPLLRLAELETDLKRYDLSLIHI